MVVLRVAVRHMTDARFIDRPPVSEPSNSTLSDHCCSKVSGISLRRSDHLQKGMFAPGLVVVMRLRRIDRDFHQGARLCRLVGSHASSEIDGWQTEARCDIQDGRTHAQAPSHHRQQRGRATGEQTRCAKGITRTDAGSQTAHAGDGRARQQDGADRLGATYQAGELQGSGRSQGVILADLRSSEM